MYTMLGLWWAMVYGPDFRVHLVLRSGDSAPKGPKYPKQGL